MTYPDALRALNQAAYAAARACPNGDEKRRLKQMCFETDALVDALPSRLDLDFHGEPPVFPIVLGARV